VGVIVPDAQMHRLHRLLGAAGVLHEQLGDAVPAGAASPEEAADGERARVSLIPATVAKGLEYDHVVVVEPAAIADAEPDERTGLRRLYVVLTRAVSRMTVVHARPLPDALATPPERTLAGRHARPGPPGADGTGDADGTGSAPAGRPDLRGVLVSAAGSDASPSAS
jgi:ATP-dependent exoDNAse (exonuclease V) beta subunit